MYAPPAIESEHLPAHRGKLEFSGFAELTIDN